MKIRLSETLTASAAAVTPVLLQKLAAFTRDPLGSHTLSALGIAVKIRLDVGAPTGDPRDGAEITLHALEAAGAFPVFNGTLRVEAVDAHASRLVLAGQYHVPLGAVGTIADRTLLAGIAKKSLRALMTAVRAEVAAVAAPRC